MAIITHTSEDFPGLLPLSLDGNLFLSITTILANNGAFYIWESGSNSGSRFTMEGNFTYPAGNNGLPIGTLTKLSIDFNNDGSDDFTIDYGTSPIALTAAMFGTDESDFWDALLAQSNTHNLFSTLDTLTGGPTVYGGNGSSGETTLAYTDIFNLEGSGIYAGDHIQTNTHGYQSASDTMNVVSDEGNVTAIGDVYSARGTNSTTGPTDIIFASDTITDSSDANNANILIGDALRMESNFFDGSDIADTYGGDDFITSHAILDTQIVGDVSGVFSINGILYGGDDTITVTSGTSTIYGDVLFADNDVVGGNDIITVTSSETAVIYGDIGSHDTSSDHIGGNDTITGGSGNDTIYGDFRGTSSGSPNLTSGNDNIDGGAGNDLIVGDIVVVDLETDVTYGSDTIDGGAGDDTIYGDYRSLLNTPTPRTDGSDIINGDAGNDIIYGQYGDDDLFGGDGDDIISGGLGDDLIDGGVGTDIASYDGLATAINITLAASGDTIVMVEGKDTLRLIEGLIGTDFDDTLTGNSLDNIFDGGFGDDTLSGGTGNDTVSYNTADLGVTVDLSITGTDQDTVGAGRDTLSGFENITGSAYDDTLFGDSNTNIIHGGDGGDTIILRSGLTGFAAPGNNNQIFGDAGNDTIGFALAGLAQSNLGTGHLFNGGDGTDTFVFETFGSDYQADLDDGFFFRVSDGTEYATLTNIENIIAGSGDDRLVGDDADNTLTGNDGDDYFFGQQGDDILNGGNGIDTADFSSNFSGVQVDLEEGTASGTAQGDDKLFSIENVIGSNLDDQILGSSLDNVLTGGGLDDVIVGFDGMDTLDGGTGKDELHGGNGDDILTGGDDNDMLYGDDDDDMLDGGDGDDTLSGGSGNDMLNGGTGTDTINGGSGNDTIYIDTQAELLTVTGGSGTDTLIWGNASGTIGFAIDFTSMGFESATVTQSAGAISQTHERLTSGDAETNVYDIVGLYDWSRILVREDLSNTQSYTKLTIYYLDGTDALDVTINELDSGNRVTTDYDAADTEDFGLSILTEDINDDELFTSVLQLRNDANEVTRFVNIYDNALQVTEDFEFSTVGTEAENLFDIVDDASWNRKVTNVDNSGSTTLLNYQKAEIYQNTALQNYGSDILLDTGVREITDNDLDGSDSWAVQVTRTDDADAFSWGTIVDQRDASGNILYLSQTNEGSYDTIDVFDVAGSEVWARTVTFVDDEGDFSWSTLTFFYDDMGVVYDTVEVPDPM